MYKRQVVPIILTFMFEIAVSAVFFHGGYITIKELLLLLIPSPYFRA